MNEETYYGIQANTILTLAQIAVMLRLIDRMAEQNGMKVDGVLPKEWFRKELRPALQAHLDIVRQKDARGAAIVEHQLLQADYLGKV